MASGHDRGGDENEPVTGDEDGKGDTTDGDELSRRSECGYERRDKSGYANVSRRGRGDGIVSRRSFVKLSGAALAAAAFGATGSAADESGDYDVVEVPRGQTRWFRIGDGETLENLIIDISARGAKYQIVASGSNWTIRNLGVRGEWDDPDKAEPFIVSVDAGSVGRIENVYLGDGTVLDNPAHQYLDSSVENYTVTGIFVSPSHAGTLEIDRVNIQDYGDNAIYGSSPGNGSEHPVPGRGGEVYVTNSYAARCVPANFRLGTDGSYCQNCVSVDGYRGYWGFYEHTELIDCDIAGRSVLGDIVLGAGSWTKSQQAEVTLTNTRFNGGTSTSGNSRIYGSSAGSPQRSRPEEVEGVPLTPEEAASGGRDAPADDGGEEGEDEESEDELPNLLTIFGDQGYAEYELGVSGRLEQSDELGATIDDDVEVGESTADGAVHGGLDSYRFSGDIETFELHAPATVYLDGEEVDPDELGRLPHLLTIHGDQGRAEYEFTVSGDIERSEENDATIDDWNVVEGSTASGHVWGGRDSYRFSGDIEAFELYAPATVYLDGEEVAPGDLASDLPRVVTIHGDQGYAEYEFAVSGDLEKSVDAGATIDEEDVVDGSTATGHVWGGRDSYRFSGEIEAFELASPATVYVDGEEVDPADLENDEDELSNLLTIFGDQGYAEYWLVVSGRLEQSNENDATIDDDVEVTESTADGAVHGGLDSYRFSGEIETFELDAPATVYLNDEEVDPGELG